MNGSLLVCLIQGISCALPALFMVVGAIVLGFAALIALAVAGAFLWLSLGDAFPLLRRRAHAARTEADR